MYDTAYNTYVGLQIRKFRKAKHMTLQELFKKTGISRSYLGNLEQGKRRIDVVHLFRISTALMIDISAFLPDTLPTIPHAAQ